MSAEHVGWAFRQKGLPPTRKFVLVALADRCNKDTLRCDPKIKTLMEDTGLGRMTVFRALEDLEDAGLIQRVERTRDNGSRTSSDYRFPSVTVVRGEYQSDTGEGVTAIPPEPELRTGSKTNTLAAAPRARPRNELWDALEVIFGPAKTRTAQTLRGKVVSSLALAGATPSEINARARRWRLHFEGATMTELALEKYWDTLPRRPLK
jgi:hypothetical protein